MVVYAYFATNLLGGGAGDVDGIDGAVLGDLDSAFCVDPDEGTFHYSLDPTSGAAEDSPYIISPDVNAGTKRWILQNSIAPKFIGNELNALDNIGMSIEDDGGNLGIFIEDGGVVGVHTATPFSQTMEIWNSNDPHLVLRNSDETVGKYTSIDFLTGSGILAASNYLGRIRLEVTDANPNPLKSRLILGINKGDEARDVIYIDDNARVGLNIADPDEELHLYVDDGTTNAYIKVEQADSAKGAGFLAANDVGNILYVTAFGSASGGLNFGLVRDNIVSFYSNGATALAFGSIDDSPVIFGQNNLEIMRLDSGTGYIGIGIIAPAEEIHVYRDAGYASGLNILVENDEPSKSTGLFIRNDVDTDFVFQLNGSTKAGTFFGINKTDLAHIYSTGADYLCIGPIDDVPLVFGQNDTEIMRIHINENVGINTVVPDKKLEINSTTGDCLRLTYNDADGGAANYTDFSVNNTGDLVILASGGEVYVGTDTATGFDLTVNNGNSGIRAHKDYDGIYSGLSIKNNSAGVNSVASFVINGQGNNFYLYNYGDNTTTPNRTEFVSTAGGSEFLFNVAAANKALFIASDGKIGIGTISPLFGVNVVKAAADLNIGLDTYSNTDTHHSIMYFRKAGGTEAAPTVVADDEALGSIIFRGYDGDEFVDAAAIKAFVDDTPGNDDMPGRLCFYVTPNGSDTLSQAMCIYNTCRTTVNHLGLEEITTPTAVGSEGALYTKADNDLYFQDGAGVEHIVSYGSFDYATMGNPYGTSTTEILGSADQWYAMVDTDIDAQILSGFTYSDGLSGNGNITTAAAGAAININDVGHGLVSDDYVTIQSANHNGVGTVTYVDDDNFTVDIAFVGNEAGTWQMGAYLECVTAGVYRGTWTCAFKQSLSNAQTTIIAPFVNTTQASMATSLECVENINDIGTPTGTGINSLAVGDRIWFSVQSSGAQTITFLVRMFTIH